MFSGLRGGPPPLDVLEYLMAKVDLILLMSVNPGFGGQSFIPSTLTKLKKVRKLIDDSGYDIRLAVDGGVKDSNIKEIKEAGADIANRPLNPAFFITASHRDRAWLEAVVGRQGQ